jgi:hypothetical protein
MMKGMAETAGVLSGSLGRQEIDASIITGRKTGTKMARPYNSGSEHRHRPVWHSLQAPAWGFEPIPVCGVGVLPDERVRSRDRTSKPSPRVLRLHLSV